MIISFFAQKGGDYLREGDYEGGDYFKYCSLEVILFYYAIKLKNNHIELTEHGLFKCSKFSSLINFRGLNHHWSVSHESHCTSTWQGGDKRKRRWWEEQWGGDYSKFLCTRGVIIQHTQLIEGQLLFEETNQPTFK